MQSKTKLQEMNNKDDITKWTYRDHTATIYLAWKNTFVKHLPEIDIVYEQSSQHVNNLQNRFRVGTKFGACKHTSK